MNLKDKHNHHYRRALRVRKRLRRVADGYWRVNIFRSHQHIYAQVIDDKAAKTMVVANDFQIKAKTGLTKSQKAFMVGQLLGQRLKKIKSPAKVVIDKGGYSYHGRVAALVEGLRQEGIKV